MSVPCLDLGTVTLALGELDIQALWKYSCLLYFAWMLVQPFCIYILA